MQFGQAEVQDLHPAVRRDHDVGRFQVAVRDALAVGNTQGVGQRDGDVEELFERHAAIPDERCDVLAIHEFHGEEVTQLGLLDRVDRDDRRMVESGHGLGLLFQPSKSGGIGGRLGGKHLDRDLASEVGVLGKVHGTHAPLTQFVQDGVVGNRLADHSRRTPCQRNNPAPWVGA